ncbi:MAG TPA: sigma-70 family RNA polymerase sigma factor [Polyangiaceae bacterium]
MSAPREPHQWREDDGRYTGSLPPALDAQGGWVIVARVSPDSVRAFSRPAGDPVVLRALDGDRSAEREICTRLLPAVRAFAARRLRASSVDDFAHDALVLLVEALREGKIQDPERVAAFALGICRNLARDRARTDDRRRELMDRYGLTEAELATWDSQIQVRRDHLEDCYSQLADRSRRVLRMSFCNEESDSDIARTLSISEANVRIIRHRTLAALRACLEKPISWTQ